MKIIMDGHCSIIENRTKGDRMESVNGNLPNSLAALQVSYDENEAEEVMSDDAGRGRGWFPDESVVAEQWSELIPTTSDQDVKVEKVEEGAVEHDTNSSSLVSDKDQEASPRIQFGSPRGDRTTVRSRWDSDYEEEEKPKPASSPAVRMQDSWSKSESEVEFKFKDAKDEITISTVKSPTYSSFNMNSSGPDLQLKTESCESNNINSAVQNNNPSESSSIEHSGNVKRSNDEIDINIITSISKTIDSTSIKQLEQPPVQPVENLHTDSLNLVSEYEEFMKAVSFDAVTVEENNSCVVDCESLEPKTHYQEQQSSKSNEKDPEHEELESFSNELDDDSQEVEMMAHLSDDSHSSHQSDEVVEEQDETGEYDDDDDHYSMKNKSDDDMCSRMEDIVTEMTVLSPSGETMNANQKKRENLEYANIEISENYKSSPVCHMLREISTKKTEKLSSSSDYSSSSESSSSESEEKHHRKRLKKVSKKKKKRKKRKHISRSKKKMNKRKKQIHSSSSDSESSSSSSSSSPSSSSSSSSEDESTSDSSEEEVQLKKRIHKKVANRVEAPEDDYESKRKVKKKNKKYSKQYLKKKKKKKDQRSRRKRKRVSTSPSDEENDKGNRITRKRQTKKIDGLFALQDITDGMNIKELITEQKKCEKNETSFKSKKEIRLVYYEFKYLQVIWSVIQLKLIFNFNENI